MSELTLMATVENLDEVLKFIDLNLEKCDCPLKTQMQIDIAVEEVFINIAKYAYKSKPGDVTIAFEVGTEPFHVIIIFIDSGIPYNPLEKCDPDITLPAEKRQIGGLGIFMVKKSMDDVNYKFSEGKNVLTLKRNL